MVICSIINYYLDPNQNIDFISVNDYRAKVEPFLGQYAIVATIFFAGLLIFLYRNFPKNDAIIPYYLQDQSGKNKESIVKQ